MERPIVESSGGVTLVAGGPVALRDLRAALQRAPLAVGVDGGADRALALGVEPAAVVGDLDSLSAAARGRLGTRVHGVAEQETTDFDKALRAVDARFVLAVGALGGRVDHELAVFSALVARAGQAVVAIGRQDVVLAAPPALDLTLRPGDRLSLYPMVPVRGESRGLDWPIDGLDLRPDGRIGTSNRVSAGAVTLRFATPGMLVILPRARLDAALDAVSPGWRDAAPRSARGG
jgi:thiamine pyrophosphokinase